MDRETLKAFIVELFDAAEAVLGHRPLAHFMLTAAEGIILALLEDSLMDEWAKGAGGEVRVKQ